MHARALVLVLPLVFAAPAEAHHAFSANFDVDNIVEVRGTITSVRWQNPHVLMTLETPVGETWAIESQAKNILERTEISVEFFPVGSAIAFAGFPAREGRGVFALNAALADGRELILRAGRPAYFGGRPAGNPDNVLAGAAGADAQAQAAGLFRVWSMQFAGESRWRWPATYPLTPAAAAAQARFDPVRDFPLGDCAAKGMPWIMEQPFPMEFVQQGGDVVLKLEEADAARTIHMQGGTTSNVQPSVYGYSVGRWDESALVVHTSAIDARYLNASGIPLTSAVTTDERFTVSADGSRLNYTLTVTDPGTFTTPLTVEHYWIWRPGVAVQRYGCPPEGDSR